MAKNMILGIMKMGKLSDMQKLYHEGEVYMRELSYFRELTEDNQRVDDSEGTFMSRRAPWALIKNEEDGTEIELSMDGRE